MRRVLSLLVLAAVPLLACGGSGVGAACTSSDGCPSRLTCETGFPGGYCTTTCAQEGAEEGCAGDALCVKSPLSQAPICALRCSTKADCRPDYECNGVTGTSVKVCQPKA